jgi:uncharacterized membrane protein YeaQ/YmgE (transglycosylase-associated protein family)
MYPLICIFMGLAIGWLGGKRLEGKGYGPHMDIFTGIGGALIGGMLMRTDSFSGVGGLLQTTVIALMCAVMLTTLAVIGNGRRVYVRAV